MYYLYSNTNNKAVTEQNEKHPPRYLALRTLRPGDRFITQPGIMSGTAYVHTVMYPKDNDKRTVETIRDAGGMYQIFDADEPVIQLIG